MPFRSLQTFVEALRKAGELTSIGAASIPGSRLAEITDRVVKAGGPALLFTDVKGSEFPVLTNQFGTRRRMAMALDVQTVSTAVAARVRAMLAFNLAAGLVARRKGRRAQRFAPLANAAPKIVRDGSVRGSRHEEARSHKTARCLRRGRWMPGRSSRCRS